MFYRKIDGFSIKSIRVVQIVSVCICVVACHLSVDCVSFQCRLRVISV